MDDKNLKEVKMVYADLVGIASQLPDSGVVPQIYNASRIVTLFNEIVDRASQTTNDNFIRYKLKDDNVITSVEYNGKVMGLLNAIKRVYLPNEPEPFSGPQPSTTSLTTINNLTNQVTIQIATDLGFKIGELLAKDPPPEEKTFLTKLKEVIPLTNGVLDLLGKITTLAASTGISVDKLKTMFG